MYQKLNSVAITWIQVVLGVVDRKAEFIFSEKVISAFLQFKKAEIDKKYFLLFHSNKKAEILRDSEGYNVLIVDEVSMCTPVTIARIDKRLRPCFNSNKVFGGIHVIFIGDFWQFKPVSKLKNLALYQGMVLQARNRRLPENEAYRVGVNLFAKFQLFNLKGQRRANTEDEK